MRASARSELAEKRHAAALVISAAAALTGLARLELFGALSLGRVTALLCVMAASLKGRLLRRGGCGDRLRPRDGRGGADARDLHRGLRLPGALRGGCSPASAGWPSSPCSYPRGRWRRTSPAGLFEDVTPLFEAFAASVIFMLLPPGLLSRAAAPLQPMSPGLGESGLRRYAARRAESISRAYLDVYGAVGALRRVR